MLGKRLQKVRKKAGVTQDELGRLLDVSKHTIASYETNRRNPSVVVLRDISDLLGVSADYLLGNKDEVF